MNLKSSPIIPRKWIRLILQHGCVEEDNIKDIANDNIKVSPNIEFHIEAVITATYEEGYDLCVDVDYTGGKLTVGTSEEYYDEYDEDEEDDE